MSEEVREKVRQSAKGRVGKFNLIPFAKGVIPWNKGKKMSDETRKKMSLSKKGKPIPWRSKIDQSGEKHYRWNPNREEVRVDRRNDPEYKQWRNKVWLRDGRKCKIANPDCLGRIEVHHILSWREHPKLRYQINNGISLCHAHHPRKWAEEKRLAPLFVELVSVSKQPNCQ